MSPLTRHHEMFHFDNQLLEWYDNLPYILKDHEPCSESIAVARTVMKWRYLNQRMLLYRPTLLSYAMRRVPYIALRSEERTSIERCREIAQATISDISSTAQSHGMSGWNAVWLLFQATMVPLLGLFLNDNTTSDPRASIESCQGQVEMAMLILARLQPWSPTAKRTLDAVARIFEASKRGSEMNGDSMNGQYATPRDSIMSGVAPPAILPSQNELSRNVMVANEVSFTDPFAPSFMDDSAGQQLWDFLSWSDSNLWPGIADLDCSPETNLFGEEKHLPKYGNSASAFFGMTDSSYYPNPPLAFY